MTVSAFIRRLSRRIAIPVSILLVSVLAAGCG